MGAESEVAKTGPSVSVNSMRPFVSPSTVVPALVRLAVLGPLEVVADERPIALGGLKQRTVLAMLAVHANQVVSEVRLIDAVWPEGPPSTAAKGLHTFVFRLRRKLGAALPIETRAPGYTIRVRSEQTDAGCAEAALLAARVAAGSGDYASAASALRAALSAWRGRPFEDFDGRSFAAAEIRRLDELRLGILEARFDADLALGDLGCISELEGLVLEHPFREKFWFQLMLGLYQSGRQADSLRAYQRLRHALATDLGLEPGPELRDLERAVLRHDPALLAGRTRAIACSGQVQEERTHSYRSNEQVSSPTAVTESLPLELTSFVGRTYDLDNIRKLITESRLVTLTGTGGIGKTRLAMRVVAESSDSDVAEVTVVELAPHSSNELVAKAIAEARGVREQPNSSVLVTLADQIGDLPVLLVLDNCEHLIEACAAACRELLVRCARLRIVATSRQPLELPGETIYQVPSLEAGAPGQALPVEAVSTIDAVRLFLDRAAASSRDFHLSPDNANTVIRICQTLEGIPLAIELAAARLRHMSLDEIADRLTDRLTVLTMGPARRSLRHQTIRATIAWSYDLLEASERRLFARLAVFAGGWTLAAAETVCRSTEPQAEIVDIQSALVDKSLLLADVSESPARYRMLETVRAYATEKLGSSGEEEAIRAAHLRWFVTFAERARRHVEGVDGKRWLDALEQEHANLREAMRWSLTGRAPDAGLRLAIALSKFWQMRGHVEEGVRSFEQALERASDLSPSLRAWALLALTDVLELRDSRSVDAPLQEALSIGRATGEVEVLAQALRSLGLRARLAGEYTASARYYEEAVAVHRASGDQKATAVVLACQGDLLFAQGDPPAARPHLEEAAELQRELGNINDLAWVLGCLGLAAADEGDHCRAREVLDEALAIHRNGSNLQGIAWVMCALGELSLRIGDVEAARHAFSEASHVHRRWGDPTDLPWSLQGLGRALMAAGDLAASRDRLLEALGGALRRGAAPEVASTFHYLAQVEAAQHRHETVARLLGASEAIRRETGQSRSGLSEADFAKAVIETREQMGQESFQAAWEEGLAAGEGFSREKLLPSVRAWIMLPADQLNKGAP